MIKIREFPIVIEMERVENVDSKIVFFQFNYFINIDFDVRHFEDKIISVQSGFIWKNTVQGWKFWKSICIGDDNYQVLHNFRHHFSFKPRLHYYD